MPARIEPIQLAACIFGVLLCVPLPALSLNLALTTQCSYQKGQWLSSSEAKDIHESRPLNWTFNNLTGEKPMFMSGGDSGEVFVVPLADLLIVYLPSPVGTHAFTIWKTGESFWNKQGAIFGTKRSQQFIGTCRN